MRKMKIFGRNKKTEENVISRKSCEDGVNLVRDRLFKKGISMGIPITGVASLGDLPPYFSTSLESVDSKDFFSSSIQIPKIKLEASTFHGSNNDHFFCYTINFPGCTDIELNLQEIALISVFGDDEVYKNYKDRDNRGSYSKLYRLRNLGLANPVSIADNIYDAIIRYDEMRGQVTGLIKKLEEAKIDVDKITKQFCQKFQIIL